MRVRDGAGQEGVLVILVTKDGAVRASLGKAAIELEPEDVSRLVNLYRVAQVVALQDRGRF